MNTSVYLVEHVSRIKFQSFVNLYVFVILSARKQRKKKKKTHQKEPEKEHIFIVGYVTISVVTVHASMTG